MNNLQELSNIYLAIGAGGLCVVVLVAIVIYLIVKVYPTLNELKTEIKANNVEVKESRQSYLEVARNSNDAIREMSRSNENVASALKLLHSSFNNFSSTMEKHDNRAEGMENEMIRMSENIKSINERLKED